MKDEPLKLCVHTLNSILSDCEQRLKILKEGQHTPSIIYNIYEVSLLITYLQQKILNIPQ